MERKKRIVRLCVFGGLLCLAAILVLWVYLSPSGALAGLIGQTHLELDRRPPQYGLFHIVCLAIFTVLVVSAFALHTRIPKRYLDDIVFSAGCFFFLIELYKQLYYHTVLGNGHYNFSILPFQLCSYILYLCLLLPLLAEGRVKDVLYRFAAFYQTAAGAIVMFCPLFYKQLALSVHTMVWHIVMVTVGVLILLLRGYGRRYFREILPAVGIFLGVFAFGLSLNVLLEPLTVNSAGELNLFYLSPYAETNNLIIADVRDALGLFPAIVTYAVLITTVCVNAVWIAGRIALLVKDKIQKRREGEACVRAEAEERAEGCEPCGVREENGG